MIIAQQKKKTNIIEYLLYIFQVEDIIRSYNFEYESVKKNIIDQFEMDDATIKEISDWYQGLILQMKDEQIKQQGHLQSIKNQIADIDELHRYLIQKQNAEYLQYYSWAKANITELQSKSQQDSISEIEACLNGLYGYLLLKLQQREVSQSTQESIESISKMMAKLNQFYFKIERGEMELEN